jgi:hypothetical protein
MLTSKLYRAARTASRVERATRNPGRYATQRAKSKALGAVGFWRLWSRWWRA